MEHCHTALLHIQKDVQRGEMVYRGATSKGSSTTLTMMYSCRNPETYISDDRFIRLIRKFLKAGYVEDWTFPTLTAGCRRRYRQPDSGEYASISRTNDVKEYIRYISTWETKRRPGKESNDLANERKRTVRETEKIKTGLRRLWSKDSKPSNRNVRSISSGDEMTEVTAGSNTSVTLDDFIWV